MNDMMTMADIIFIGTGLALIPFWIWMGGLAERSPRFNAALAMGMMWVILPGAAIYSEAWFLLGMVLLVLLALTTTLWIEARSQPDKGGH